MSSGETKAQRGEGPCSRVGEVSGPGPGLARPQGPQLTSPSLHTQTPSSPRMAGGAGGCAKPCQPLLGGTSRWSKVLAVWAPPRFTHLLTADPWAPGSLAPTSLPINGSYRPHAYCKTPRCSPIASSRPALGAATVSSSCPPPRIQRFSWQLPGSHGESPCGMGSLGDWGPSTPQAQ